MVTKVAGWERQAKKSTGAVAERAAVAAKTVAEIPAEKEPHKYQPGFKPPKTLAACADAYYLKNKERLAAQKLVDAIELAEKDLKAYLLEKLPTVEASGVSGTVARVSIVIKEAPQADDWSKIYAGIVADYNKHAKKKDGLQDGAFSLIGRSLTKATIAAMWKDGKSIDGISVFHVTTLSVNKL